MAKQIDYQLINDLIDGILAGDEESIEEAQEMSAKLSKRANTRLRALEEEGLTTGQAYEAATYYLEEDMNRSRFSQSKGLEGEELVRNLEIVSDFLKNPGSTVSYERDRRAGLLDMDDILPDDFSQYDKRQLRKFFASDAWEEYKSMIYIHKKGKTEAESREAKAAIAGAADAISRGASVNDLTRLYEQYREQTSVGEEASIFDVFEEWEK